MQLADELEAKQKMVKADWECWKEADKQREALDLQINGPSLFEWVMILPVLTVSTSPYQVYGQTEVRTTEPLAVIDPR